MGKKYLQMMQQKKDQSPKYTNSSYIAQYQKTNNSIKKWAED